MSCELFNRYQNRNNRPITNKKEQIEEAIKKLKKTKLIRQSRGLVIPKFRPTADADITFTDAVDLRSNRRFKPKKVKQEIVSEEDSD